MKSRILIIGLVMFSLLQNSLAHNPIFSKIRAAKDKIAAQSVDLMSKVQSLPEDQGIYEGLTSFTLYDISPTALGSVLANDFPLISVELDHNDASFELEMVETPFLDPDFKVLNARDEVVEVPTGKFYRGTVNGHPNSLAAVAFFNGEVIGVISTGQGENFVLGKMRDESEQYIFYPENGLSINNPFVCGTDASMHIHREEVEEPMRMASAEPCKKVNVYIEVDDIMYNDFSRNMTAVTNYVTGVWNVSSLLYENEDIILGIKTIKIWDTDDPYRKNSANNLLDDFSSNIKNDIDGDIAHILTTSSNNMGGLAWVDVLCSSYRSFNDYNRTAMSNINRNYRQYPLYSWTVMVVTHEQGHNLGSPHTHSCSWGPNNNEALDNCASTEGGCPRGPSPTGGGTIMSYCHLTSHGINFTRGFGPEPGDRIRNRVQNAGCLGGAFEATVDIVGDVSFYEGDSTLLMAQPAGPQYAYQWYRDGFIIQGATDPELYVKTDGSYRCDITTSCTEMTPEIDVEVNPFYVSLICPFEEGGMGEESEIFDTIYVDTDEEETTLVVPPTLYNAVPPDAINQYVEMRVCVGNYSPARLVDLVLFYTGPDGSNLDNVEFEEHKSTIFGDVCYDLNLGDFDPTGEWTFVHSHPAGIRPNSPEAYAWITIRQKWESAPKPSDCDVTICEGDTIQLDAGFDDLTYRWSTGASSRTINVWRSGNYGVTVSNGNIERSDDINVTVLPSRYEIDTIVCRFDGFQLGENTIRETGTYTDTLIGHTGCDSIIDLTLTVMDNQMSSSELEVCMGETVQGVDVFGDTVLYQRFEVGEMCDSVHVLNISVRDSIDVDLDVTEGCEDVGATVVPSVTNAVQGADYTFNWEDGVTADQRDGIKSGFILVTTTDDIGCTATDSVLVTNFDSVALETEISHVICYGDSTGAIDVEVLGGTPEFEFNWSSGDTTQGLDQLPAGTYDVIVTDANMCQEMITVQISENDQIEANATVTGTSGGNDNGQIVLAPTGGTGNYTYNWSDGSTDSERNDLANGIYTVTITDDSGCSETFMIEIKMSSSLESLTHLKSYELYPNPVANELHFNLQLHQSQKVSLEIFSPLGQRVFVEPERSEQRHQFSVDVSDWNGGLYLMRVNVDGEIGVVQFVVR